MWGQRRGELDVGLVPPWVWARFLPPLGACRALMRTFKVCGVHQPVPTDLEWEGPVQKEPAGPSLMQLGRLATDRELWAGPGQGSSAGPEQRA